ncbi:hypothetical protein QPK87_10375 [Kamptonema cortianum]|nr:hypothetical protein [Geitlerinema splendidum]MDK3156981.1 hypothetical protein [Kamptonema cortianum]
MVWMIWSLVLVATSLVVPPAPSPPLELRRGEISILPPQPLPLGGYTERGTHEFEPGGEDLRARIVHLRQGKTSVAVVSIESLTIPESLRKEVARRIWPEANVLLIATHTHCAPDSQMLNDRMTFRIPGIAPYTSQWLDWYATRIAGGIAQTLASKPVELRSLQLEESSPTGLSRGRRVGAKPDSRVRWLRGESDPLLVTFAAHATILEAGHRQTSGDWPGELMRESGAIFVPAAIGDASPAVDGGSGKERIQRMATQLIAAEVSTRRTLPNVTLRWDSEVVQLPSPKPHPNFAAEYKVNNVLASMVVGRFAPPDSKVTAVAIGPFLLLGIPGEPTAEVGRRIARVAEEAGYIPWIVSHANGWAGYILTEPDYLSGGYEATLAFHGPEAATRFIEATERLVRRLGSYRADQPAATSTRG